MRLEYYFTYKRCTHYLIAYLFAKQLLVEAI